MSHFTTVADDESRQRRLNDLQIQDEKKQQEFEKAKKNNDFTQVTPKGWRRIQSLIKENPALARLYAFLAEHIDGVTGTVVCSQDLLAEKLDVHVVTIRRQSQQLEKLGALVRIRVGSGVYAYALDPEEIWRSWANRKDNAAFVTRTLVDKRDSHNQAVIKKLKTMYFENKKD